MYGLVAGEGLRRWAARTLVYIVHIACGDALQLQGEALVCEGEP